MNHGGGGQNPYSDPQSNDLIHYQSNTLLTLEQYNANMARIQEARERLEQMENQQTQGILRYYERKQLQEAVERGKLAEERIRALEAGENPSYSFASAPVATSSSSNEGFYPQAQVANTNEIPSSARIVEVSGSASSPPLDRMNQRQRAYSNGGVQQQVPGSGYFNSGFQNVAYQNAQQYVNNMNPGPSSAMYSNIPPAFVGRQNVPLAFSGTTSHPQFQPAIGRQASQTQPSYTPSAYTQAAQAYNQQGQAQQVQQVQPVQHAHGKSPTSNFVGEVPIFVVDRQVIDRATIFLHSCFTTSSNNTYRFPCASHVLAVDFTNFPPLDSTHTIFHDTNTFSIYPFHFTTPFRSGKTARMFHNAATLPDATLAPSEDILSPHRSNSTVNRNLGVEQCSDLFWQARVVDPRQGGHAASRHGHLACPRAAEGPARRASRAYGTCAYDPIRTYDFICTYDVGTYQLYPSQIFNTFRPFNAVCKSCTVPIHHACAPCSNWSSYVICAYSSVCGTVSFQFNAHETESFAGTSTLYTVKTRAN
ncbi:uncharacterized protein BXZ73DRAFT_99459 [Epithele typhae]|uniref:uncharacterized protein n=1 Tax=Epithele typhae TaxID=378194 RepID=UPI002008376E|nr:uncharacterized protein BXZ73DRAFT_99459 [Epithele typhae]KAH9939256.1 hypothetical protein BXZ73DRAFT_99459 [Epithele typhae]